MQKTSYCNRSDAARDNPILISIIANSKRNSHNFMTYTSEKLQNRGIWVSSYKEKVRVFQLKRLDAKAGHKSS